MKKPTGHIYRIQINGSLWVLIFLVSFFSSCTIRKGIQANFEIPVTKQLNPSKAVSGQYSACHYSETDVKATAFIQKSITGSGFLELAPESGIKFLSLFYKKKDNVISGWPLTLKVESYILFRQMKSDVNHLSFLLQDSNQG